MSESNNTWYVMLNGRRHGPLRLDRFVQMIGTGRIGPDDLVWRQGFRTWKTAKETDVFQNAVQQKKARTAAAEETWYSMRGDHIMGPFTTQDMFASIRDGMIMAHDLVWRSRWQKWVTADKIKEFAGALDDARESMESELWYYKDNDEIKGPLNFVQLREQVIAGELPMDLPVYSKQLGNWKKIADVDRLKGLAPDAPPAGEEEEMWYYRKDKETIGPVCTDALIRRIRDGELKPGDWVYNLSAKTWRRNEEVDELTAPPERFDESTENGSDPAPDASKEAVTPELSARKDVKK